MIINKQKTITVCIIGKPNAGKSSLLNRLIGQKISIVTPKVQTTRSIITGIITLKDTQLIIFDTPGIFTAKKNLEKAMVRCAWSSLNSADIVMLVIDSTKKLTVNVLQITNQLKALNITPVLLVNKIDLYAKKITSVVEQLTAIFPNAEIFKISAVTGEGINALIKYLTHLAKPTPWVFKEDDVTNLSWRFLAAELTREQLFLHTQQELPYNLTVQTELWEENQGKSVKVKQIIIVSRENYKMIILGKGGLMIKKISMQARLAMEKSFGCKIHLFLFVKVREMWDSNPEYYDYLGLKIR